MPGPVLLKHNGDGTFGELATVQTSTSNAVPALDANGLLPVNMLPLGTGVGTFLATPSSANLAAAMTDETGTGAVVFAASPTFTGTPAGPTAATDTNTTQLATTAYVVGQGYVKTGGALGTPTSGTLTSCTGLPAAGVVGTAGVLSVVGAWTKSQSSTPVTLTSTTASIAVDASLSNTFTHTFTEATTLANPSNLVAGTAFVILFTQHASSPKTLAFGSYYKFKGGIVPTVTAANSAQDSLVCFARTTTLIDCVLVWDIK